MNSDLESRVNLIINLGIALQEIVDNQFQPTFDPGHALARVKNDFCEKCTLASLNNPWFTQDNVRIAVSSWAAVLNSDDIEKWLKPYLPDLEADAPAKNIGIVMAGNVPMVGLHDLLCAIISGHKVIARLSSNDIELMTGIYDLITALEPEIGQGITLTENRLQGFDAIIATGSNNTARYFEYYFSKYPHIIRKNRNGVAVLTGDEDTEALTKLGVDICTYFGLGCRNISKVFIPEGFAPEKLYSAVEPFNNVLFSHFKYMNNHSYHRSIYLLNNKKHLDNNVFILTESEQYSSPIPVLFYEFYKDLESLMKKILQDDELIQCIATDAFTNDKTVPLGCTQSPGLGDYADGIDTLQFLIDL